MPRGGDILLIDLTTTPFTETQITNDGVTNPDTFPQTDGNSVVWTRGAGANQDVMFYDIASGQQTSLFTTTGSIDGNRLQIDAKQVVWLECPTPPCPATPDNLFFNNGSGTSSGTSQITLPGGTTVNGNFRPYLSNGIVTWVGNDGDDEIFVMQ